MNIDNNGYWNGRYLDSDSPWDIGKPSPALIDYVRIKASKETRILFPGCGYAHEGAILHREGYNIFLLDFAEETKTTFLERNPDFPEHKFFTGDFFEHSNQYDLIIEQTFFCALSPSLRKKYVSKMHELLNADGVLAGLLFHDPLNTDKPPFGGNDNEYKQLFEGQFEIIQMDICQNSIPPRLGRELFIEFRKADS